MRVVEDGLRALEKTRRERGAELSPPRAAPAAFRALSKEKKEGKIVGKTPLQRLKPTPIR